MVTPDRLFITRFAVANKYIAVTHNERRLIIIGDSTLINEDLFNQHQYNPPQEGEHIRYYSVSDIDSIYTHLGNVKGENDLIKFAHQFGLLGIIDKVKTPLLLAELTSATSRISIQDDIEESLKVAQDMRDMLEFLGDAEKDFMLDYKNQIMDLIIDFYPEYADFLKKANGKTFLKAYVTLRVSRNLGGVRPVANFDNDGNPIPGFAYFSLIDAIWHSLYLSITGQAKFKQCPFCNSWHTGRGEYCPPPPMAKRSLCENAHSQKKYRARTKIKKLHQRGKTVEEIRKATGIAIEEIIKTIKGGLK